MAEKKAKAKSPKRAKSAKSQKGESVPREEVIKRLGRGSADKVWTVTSLALAYLDRFGEEALDLVKKIGYGRGVRNAPRIEKLMKEAGADFNDPREVRKYLRENNGFLGYVEHADDKVEVKPDGKIRVEYRITRCPWVDVWNEMGIPKEMQFKLDSCLGVQTDTATMEYFNIKYECDQGMPQGRDCCKFVLEKL